MGSGNNKTDNLQRVFIAFIFINILTQVESPLFSLDVNLSINQYVLDEWSSRSGLPTNLISAIVQTADGYIWFGTANGLLRFDGHQFTVFNNLNIPGLSDNKINSLYVNREGVLWFSTNEGLFKYSNGNFKKYNQEDGLSSNIITVLLEDVKGNLWVGTINGINRITREGKERFQLDKSLESIPVTTLLEDREGSIWIGTNGFGIKRYRAGKFITFTEKEGLESSKEGKGTG